MRNALARIFYFEWRIFGAIIFLNLRHFNWKRTFFTFLFFIGIPMISLLTVLLRIADEIFYPAYHQVQVQQPVFIISNPRSGTTYMHRLLCLDNNRFTHFLLYHTFLPSVTFYRFILLLKRIDRQLNWPLKRFFTKVEKKLFAGWKNMHPMGFEESEEDEGIFIFSLMSPAIGLICPWFSKMDWIWIADQLSEAKKEAMMAYYRNTIQRFLYAWGSDRIFLNKNVISTGRIGMLLKAFPDAKIIYPVRHPYQTIPSVTSMFASPWCVVAEDIPERSKEYRTWGKLNEAFYLHFEKMCQRIPPNQLYSIRYDEFVKQPEQTVLDLYRHFDWKPDEAFLARLKAETSARKSYRSKHTYSLDQYGYSRKQLFKQLMPVFQRFGFKP